ncbi:hypothetical protein [Paraburkholderia phenazinium]|jgi:hypothetical protein|uniref:Uncharacterized protein n=1 Tax=Paraburkholderia phenazinium TaxID=60549 RepID=A0A1G7UNB4_9BURK|nr:hypothetical protein [Paraburkholderia phenazinium]SDG48967.1 hypothetical protein SAMN05216466_103531 [Paraburkholderia phenazinium]
MKTSSQVSHGGGKHRAHGKETGLHAGRDADSLQDKAAPLPHETDQSVESQHEDEPRGVGKQAHRDLQRGLKDTDRRGGDEYQQKTQNDAHSNANSRGEPQREHRGKH